MSATADNEYAGARVLILDESGNLHSVYRPNQVLGGGYWDYLATLPSLVPAGPIAMLGLGAGTVPRIIAAHYPCGRDGRHVIHGWELDPAVVAGGRLHMGMQELESEGALVVHVGDALAAAAPNGPGFSGVIVDLFGEGRLLPQLTKRPTWDAIRNVLAPVDTGARVIVNLGHAPPAVPGMTWHPEAYTTLRAYEALEAAFDGDVSLMRVPGNILALTGPLPSRNEWSSLPGGLRHLAAEGQWLRDMYPLQKALPDT